MKPAPRCLILERFTDLRHALPFRLRAVFLFCLFLSLPFAAAYGSEGLPAKYERALKEAQQLNVREYDVLHVMPKLHMASQAMIEEKFDDADRLLTEALADLELLNSRKPLQMERTFRLQWLEIYRDIFQKYALLALIAFLFASIPYFRRMLQSGRWTAMGRVYWTIAAAMIAIFLSFFDTRRYGISAWMFFDVHVVFAAISGLIGGFLPGLFTGLIIGLFRLLLKPDVWTYFLIAVLSGVIGGLWSLRVHSYRFLWRPGALAGFIAGAVHGLMIYLPLAGTVPGSYIVMSILVLIVLEGTAVWVFSAVISGILQQDHKMEVEKELLKTKLMFLQAQISPHFLFNALNTVAAICSRENAQEARKLILNLSSCFRRALRQDQEKIPLSEELAYIDAYLTLEKARYQERVNVVKDYRIPDELQHLKIPMFILQPLVENAVKHGIGKKESGGTLTIRLVQEEDDLVVTVSDDGAGAGPERVKDVLEGKVTTEEGGVGLKNIQERLRRLYGPRYALGFESVKGTGSHVTVRFPILKLRQQGGVG